MEERCTKEAIQREILAVLEIINECELFDPPLTSDQLTKEKLDIFTRTLNESLCLEGHRARALALSANMAQKRAHILNLEEEMSRDTLVRIVTNPKRKREKSKRKYILHDIHTLTSRFQKKI